VSIESGYLCLTFEQARGSSRGYCGRGNPPHRIALKGTDKEINPLVVSPLLRCVEKTLRVPSQLLIGWKREERGAQVCCGLYGCHRRDSSVIVDDRRTEGQALPLHCSVVSKKMLSSLSG